MKPKSVSEATAGASGHAASSTQRLHDLDALRASAMLLGIVYHAALSFAAGFPWVQDVAQSKGAFVFQAWVHGFRMQLFMLLSGFFTAMLWRKKGLKSLLWHRCRRVLFPCLLGLITVVPAMNWASDFAIRTTMANRAVATTAMTGPPAPATNLWDAVKFGDVRTFDRFTIEVASLTNAHPVFRTTPLTWAALCGRHDIVMTLLERGVPVDGRNGDGGTALHAAGFMGHADVVALLLRRGADVNATNGSGETILRSAERSLETVQYVAGLLGLPLDEATWRAGREKVQAQLRELGAKSLRASDDASPSGWRGVVSFLIHQPVFILVWFLWLLVWLLAIFSVYALLADRFQWRMRPNRLILSPANLLWLVPLTLGPTALMGPYPGIGPDTSMSIVPMRHVLAYYALFFFFGVIYFDCDDREDRLGGAWRWMLPVTVLVVFPLALEFTTGTFGLREALLPAKFHRPASVVLQSLFAWMMSFSSIGIFRSLLTRENQVIRYLSDSSYWLYLAHLPICIAAQALISQWPMPAWIKLPLLSLALAGFLLLTYELLVRYTWVGALLNGRKHRPAQGARPRSTSMKTCLPLFSLAGALLLANEPKTHDFDVTRDEAGVPLVAPQPACKSGTRHRTCDG